MQVLELKAQDSGRPSSRCSLLCAAAPCRHGTGTAAHLLVVLHVGVVFVEPAGQVQDGVRGPLLGNLGEALGQAAAQVPLQILRVHELCGTGPLDSLDSLEPLASRWRKSDTLNVPSSSGFKVRRSRSKEKNGDLNSCRRQAQSRGLYCYDRLIAFNWDLNVRPASNQNQAKPTVRGTEVKLHSARKSNSILFFMCC